MNNAQFRKATFVNKGSLAESFGIQTQFKNRWITLGKNGEPTLYATETERDTELERLRKSVKKS
jgi:hypothetical protein